MRRILLLITLVGCAPSLQSRGASGGELDVLVFNIHAGKDAAGVHNLERVAEVVRATGADVVLLQEVDRFTTRSGGEDHVARLATLTGMHSAFGKTLDYQGGQYGIAVLSRWPIVEDAKIVLPHRSRFVGTHRTATAATVRIGESLVRVYSTHLGTIANVGPEARRNQLRAILTDAEKYSRVIIGGDLNNPWVGSVAREQGYAWPTEKGPRTAIVGRLDHIFLKGLAAPERAAAGTVIDGPKASDHRPVWARAILQ